MRADFYKKFTRPQKCKGVRYARSPELVSKSRLIFTAATAVAAHAMWFLATDRLAAVNRCTRHPTHHISVNTECRFNRVSHDLLADCSNSMEDKNATLLYSCE